jgi:hypothetical protein
MERDPHQVDNLYGRADDALLNALRKRLKDLKDCTGAQCREAEG